MFPESGTVIPEELRRFIARYIESLEKLEILLLLHGMPDKAWSIQDVYQRILSSQNSIRAKLTELAKDGLLKTEMEGCFRYEAKTKDIGEAVALLRAAYGQSRIKVIEMIFSQSTDDLRRFSDAFNLRRNQE